MIGKIVDTKGLPGAHTFVIENNDGQRYFAHLGDLEQNEQYLYGNADTVIYLDLNQLTLKIHEQFT